MVIKITRKIKKKKQIKTKVILNPKTNRWVKDTVENRKKIKDYLSKKKVKKIYIKLEPVKVDRVIKKIVKPVYVFNTVPPPMGPVVHYNYIESSEHSYDLSKRNKIIENNCSDIFKYIYYKRFPYLVSLNKPLSKMEVEDLLILGKECRKVLLDNLYINTSINNECQIVEKSLKNKYNQGNYINNTAPHGKLIYDISSSRYEIRKTLTKIFSRIRDALYEMKKSIETKDFTFLITEAQIKRILNDKLYLDELIRLYIFTYTDIYSNIFKSDRVFDQIRTVYTKYMDTFDSLKTKYKVNIHPNNKFLLFEPLNYNRYPRIDNYILQKKYNILKAKNINSKTEELKNKILNEQNAIIKKLVAERASKNASERASKNAAERASKNAAERASKNAAERASKNAAERAAKNTTKRINSRVSQHTFSRVAPIKRATAPAAFREWIPPLSTTGPHPPTVD